MQWQKEMQGETLQNGDSVRVVTMLLTVRPQNPHLQIWIVVSGAFVTVVWCGVSYVPVVLNEHKHT